MGEEYDVVVIGAGLSGLVAAYTVLKEMPSAKLVVLESSDHIGGPIIGKEMETANGKVMYDIGSARIGTEQKEMLAFVKELGLEIYDQYHQGTKFWQLPDGKMKSYSGKIPPLGYTSLADFYRFFKKVDSLSQQMNLEDPTQCKHVEEWDKKTFKDFRYDILHFEEAKQTADTLVGSFFTMHTTELKLMQYLYVIASDGGWDNHSDKDGVKKLNHKIKGGMSRVCEELAQKISESSIVKNESVTSVEQGGDQKSAIVRTKSGKQFTAKKVICAVAENHVGAIQFDPPLKIDRGAAFPKVIPMINCLLTYSTAFWREAGQAGEVLSMSGTLGMLDGKDDHPVVGVFDHQSGDGNPALMAVMGAPGLQKKSMEERKQVLLKYIKDVFGDKVMDPLDYHDYVWDTDYRGPPPSTDVKPSVILSQLRTPHGCVHWAGAHTATAWNGSLAGALQAGRRAANEVVSSLK